MFFHTHGPVTDKPLNFIDLGKRMVVRKKKSSSPLSDIEQVSGNRKYYMKHVVREIWTNNWEEWRHLHR